jgi:methionyl-tRNA formyltransferase
MNIIYFAGGNRLETLKQLSKSEHFAVSQIYVTSIETNLESYLAFAKEKGIKITVANKYNISELFNYTNEEILLSVGYRFIIPENIFSIPPYAINIHPSLLPKYKGAYSGFAIIENGESQTGITAHFIDEGIDTGDIVYQKVIPLDISDSVVSMGAKVMEIEPSFVLEILMMIRENSYKRVKQKKIGDEVVFNNKRTPKDSEVDSSLSLNVLVNQIRACDAERFPAYFIVNNRKVNIRLEFEDSQCLRE